MLALRIGLVLSGGFAKGAYQIGALRAMSEFVPIEDIKYISAASIGAINAYAYITGNLDLAEEMWKGICGDQSKRFITKIMRSAYLQDSIMKLGESGSQISIPFYCTLLDIKKRSLLYKDVSAVPNSKMGQYLRAAIALPPYNSSVTIDDTSYFDGGLVDNIPVSPLAECDLDYIICMYFDDTNYRFENIAFDNKIVKITFPATTMVAHSFFVTPERIEEMIHAGYELTMLKLSGIFYKGYDNLPHIYHAIAANNQFATNENSLRLTTDVVITNLNKITQKLTKRKIL